MSFNKKPYRKFERKAKSQTTEEKIKDFITRNSTNGYFTKVSTLSYKFEISEGRAWEIVGDLLDGGDIESVHDENKGEMKLCETGKTYLLLDLELKRRREKFKEFKKNKKNPKNKNEK